MRLFVVLAALLAGGCRNQDGEIAYLGSKTTSTVTGLKVAPSEAGARALAGIRQFGWELARAARLGTGNSNGVVAPAGTTQALALMANAADGPARDRLLEMLRVTPGSLETYNEAQASLLTALAQNKEVTIANSAWCVWPLPVRPEFQEDVAPAYWAKVTNLGSAGRESLSQINTWCDKQTRGRIPRLFESLDTRTAMVFSHAIAATLGGVETTTGRFQSATGEARLPMVSLTHEFQTADLDGTRIARVRAGAIQTTFVIPREGKTLQVALDDLASGLIERSEAAFVSKSGRLRFPAFRSDTEANLVPSLARLPGGETIQSADLRYLSHELEDRLPIAVHQRIVLELGAPGHGTEPGPTPKPSGNEFLVNRPFLLLVDCSYRDRQIPLIIAAVHNPR